MSHRDTVLIEAEALKALIGHDPSVVLLHVVEGDVAGIQGIPGAIAVDTARHFAGAGGGLAGARPLPALADLQENARAWGIGPASTVILYDERGALKAARGWWVLRWAGLADVRLLNGGLAAWQAAGFATEDLAVAKAGGDVELSGGHLPVLDADDAAQIARTDLLFDARAITAFEGDAAAKTGGHIPGSISAPASGNLDADGRFLETEVLRQRFAALGADGGKAIGVTCGSGVSAAHDIAALAVAGFEAALFVGSWSAWSADPNRPVAYGKAPVPA